LLANLRGVPELRIDDTGEWSKNLFPVSEIVLDVTNGPPDPSQLRNLLKRRDDLAGLPFRWYDGCEIKGKQLQCLTEVSRTITALNGSPIRTNVFVVSESSTSGVAFGDRCQEILDRLEDPNRWSEPEYVSALEQTLQVEGETIVLALVDALARIDDRRATQALARRALFDLSPTVRRRAVDALRTRTIYEFRGLLTSGLRYPWAPVAHHAADALVELKIRTVVPKLIRMLDQPPPTAPQRDRLGRWVVRDLVKVNHMRNCTLCHPPSTPESFGELRGLVPMPGERLPMRYYDGMGNSVRADVTYLRQDSSVVQAVEDSEPWPAVQRFDFLVRTRVLSPQELEKKNAESSPDRGESLHRQTLLYVLRELTGKDGGDDSQRWRQLVGLIR
jgi:hypothetical protein